MKYVPKDLGKAADVSRGTRNIKTFLKNAAGVVLFFGALYAGLGFVASGLASSVSDRHEVRFFAGVPKKMEAKKTDLRRAEKIFQRLLRQGDLRSLSYRLFALDMPEPNAIAIPGGGVGVTPLLLKKVESDIGLAMVLAHELGHHQHRDCLKRMGRGLVYQLVMVTCFGAGRPSAMDATLLAGEMRYSRKQERAADEFGLRMVRATFGSSKGALEFFEKIHDEYGSGDLQWGAFLSSHPETKERIAYLRELQGGNP